MASQRVTLAKIGGVAVDAVAALSRRWAAARTTADPCEWSSEQWPLAARKEADDFARALRAHCCEPPVISFAEWSDLWSMGDVFDRLLSPPESPDPIWIYADRYEIRGYMLPDDGRLNRHLAGHRRRPHVDEYELLAMRLREAISSWDTMVERAALVLLREPVGGFVTDDELLNSLRHMPEWLARHAEPGVGAASR